MIARTLPILVLLSCTLLTTGSPVAAATSTTPIAAAINGNIVLFHADGAGKRVITHSGIDGSPLTSTGGLVAFLRTPSGPQHNHQQSVRRDVMLAAPGSHGGYAVTNFAFKPQYSTPSRTALAWEPGAHAPGLFWFNRNTVVWRRATGNSAPGLSIGPVGVADNVTPIAVSPADSEVAVPLSPASYAVPPDTLRIAVAAGGTHIVTARFRPHILTIGNDPTRGSYPVGDGLTFSDAHHLLFGTIARGAGYQLTGVFRVSDRGGVARMILGRGNGVHGRPPFGPALDGATQFKLSPNGKYFATDPRNGFWISGNVARPYAIPIALGRSCVLSQWTWLPDSSGLAYVTVCTVPGTSIQFALTLATVSVRGGRPHTLAALHSSNQQAIDLASAYRCVACGG